MAASVLQASKITLFHNSFLRKVIFKYLDEIFSLKTYPEVLKRISLHDKFKVMSLVQKEMR